VLGKRKSIPDAEKRTPIFWVITQRIVVILFRNFGNKIPLLAA
jgi:hypothetical protein